ncbi:MAG: NUDIX hydrolase [Planctomycetota bacterium]|nr:MAG: NUDIX hydrolase [Planctomycetota bacterium]
MPQPLQHGPWQILARREVYRDPWIVVIRDEVIRPDGHPGSHCIVRLKAGVSVLAVDASNTVYLTEEFHYGVGRVTVEAVSGGIDGDEQPAETARRELCEELGITAEEWIDLGTCDPLTSVVTSPTGLFLAQGLTFGPTTLEGTETLRCRSMPLEEALQMVLDGRITHAPSCVLILKTARLLGV